MHKKLIVKHSTTWTEYLFIYEQFLPYVFRPDNGTYGWNAALSYAYSAFDEKYIECTYDPGRLFHILSLLWYCCKGHTNSVSWLIDQQITNFGEISTQRILL